MKNLREETLRSRPLDNRPTHRKVLERSSHWRMQIKGEVVLGWWEIPWAGESAKDMDPHTPWWRAAPLFRTNSQYFLKMVTTDYNMIATLLICNWEKWNLHPHKTFSPVLKATFFIKVQMSVSDRWVNGVSVGWNITHSEKKWYTIVKTNGLWSYYANWGTADEDNRKLYDSIYENYLK